MIDFNDVLYKLIGERVSEFRKANKTSQDELSKKANVGRTTISNIESGKQQVSIHTLLQIAEALNLEIHSLIPLYSEVKNEMVPQHDKVSEILDQQNIDEILKSTIKGIDR